MPFVNQKRKNKHGLKRRWVTFSVTELPLTAFSRKTNPKGRYTRSPGVTNPPWKEGNEEECLFKSSTVTFFIKSSAPLKSASKNSHTWYWASGSAPAVPRVSWVVPYCSFVPHCSHPPSPPGSHRKKKQCNNVCYNANGSLDVPLMGFIPVPFRGFHQCGECMFLQAQGETHWRWLPSNCEPFNIIELPFMSLVTYVTIHSLTISYCFN